ncbi:uncharacterized protein [Malus domestica]|uniref:uncharacterized protein n=1 Tax=Malus domestica TaxID=3750 RepID=UPI00397653A2
MEEQSGRRTRGAAIPKWKEKQLCLFDSKEKCVSENASEFSKLVASEVKDPRLIPLKKDWRLVPEDVKDGLWERIKGYIIFLDEDLDRIPLIRNMTLHVADHAYKEYRNNLKAEYYTKDKRKSAWNLPLVWMVEVAEKNKFNRESKTMNHTTGSKTFARVREELKRKHGKEPDPISFFRATHTRKDDSWIDESSQQRGSSMESQVQFVVESGQEDTSDVRTQIYVEQMGSETRNRVRGYGHGVIPEMVSYASSSGSRSSRSSSKGSFAKVVAENNELRRREEEASRKLAEVMVELEKSKTSQQQAMNQQMLMNQHQIMLWLQSIRPPPSPQASQHSAPLQPPAPVYSMHHMPFQPQYPMPVYRPKMASPGDAHFSQGGFNGGLSSGFLSGLVMGSFDGDVMRYLEAHGGLAEGVGSQGGSAEGVGSQGGSAEGSGAQGGSVEGSGSVE